MNICLNQEIYYQEHYLYSLYGIFHKISLYCHFMPSKDLIRPEICFSILKIYFFRKFLTD